MEEEAREGLQVRLLPARKTGTAALPICPCRACAPGTGSWVRKLNSASELPVAAFAREKNRERAEIVPLDDVGDPCAKIVEPRPIDADAEDEPLFVFPLAMSEPSAYNRR